MSLPIVKLQIEFVENVPAVLKEHTLYLSILYSTAIHLCPCGCKEEVVTKIAPHRWCFKYDGESISLFPSIGNFNQPCQSHYWIIENKIIWANKLSPRAIARIRDKELKSIRRFYDNLFY